MRPRQILLFTSLMLMLTGIGSTLPAKGEIRSGEIHFADRLEAAGILSDMKTDPYLSKLGRMELLCRIGSGSAQSVSEGSDQAYKKKETKRLRVQLSQIYRDNTLDFTASEKQTIRWFVGQIMERVQPAYPVFSKLPWKFIKVSSRVEGGLPHTRADYIIFPKMVCTYLERITDVSKKELSHMQRQFVDLMIHEQLHVFQRINPGIFDALYTNHWGFIKADTIVRGPWLKKHELHNPDDVHQFWVFPIKSSSGIRFIWPTIVLAEGNRPKRMGSDFRMIGIDLIKNGDRKFLAEEKNGKPGFAPLSSIKPYHDLFKISYNIYSPDEAMADLFSKLIRYRFFDGNKGLTEKRKTIVESVLLPLEKQLKKIL